MPYASSSTEDPRAEVEEDSSRKTIPRPSLWYPSHKASSIQAFQKSLDELFADESRHLCTSGKAHTSRDQLHIQFSPRAGPAPSSDVEKIIAMPNESFVNLLVDTGLAHSSQWEENRGAILIPTAKSLAESLGPEIAPQESKDSKKMDYTPSNIIFAVVFQEDPKKVGRDKVEQSGDVYIFAKKEKDSV